ncbi:MAG: DUF2520 domain-containing protein [Mariniphaga sp.]|nr:DUF2520 domain-containing protein [Mariniphaga sp.]
MSHRIVFVGAGNLATQLSLELKRKGHTIEQVYSRTASSATLLSQKLKTHYTTIPWKIKPNADIYFIALQDSAYDDVLPHAAFGNSLVVHCSGSMPMASLEKYAKNTGVFYPLLTFSKQIPVHFNQIPVFVEANSEENAKILLEIAGNISGNVSVMHSERRLFLHISAVFACNFVNHFYAIASDILKEKNIPFNVLLPLIEETAGKIKKTDPALVQTGPAVRYDQQIISAHLNALQEFPHFRELYENISESIFRYYKAK